jgi:cell division protein FtsL
VLLIAIPISVIGGGIYRAKRGKELNKAEWNNIFEKALAAAFVAIILIFAFLIYFNNRPW